ncbi:MAG: C40 family peptidase [Prevotellaceae bacterium]|jgi:SH3-like domain-containing protein|nr:C40 family peptidase [Prevotellaceae bacterium]
MKKLLILLLLFAAGLRLSAAEPLKGFAVVNLSVCNMRAEADFSSEMITQGLMGMPVRVLEHDGWYRIQTPDDYIGWVHNAGIHLMDEAELHAWNAAEKVVVTAHYGFVYREPKEKSQTVSDVVAGDRLKYAGKKGKFYRVSYPDGRTGYILKKISMPEEKWRKSLRQDVDDILRTARTMMGIPYLWAGTSTKGMDCSGFMRTILYMHDIIIPRDASQQALTGERIEIAPDFGNLQPGDFVFFGRKATADKPERVVHVGMYLGGKRFIHSQGDVRINSFDTADPLFDAYNLGRLLFAARILPYINRQPGLNTTATNPYYHY